MRQSRVNRSGARALPERRDKLSRQTCVDMCMYMFNFSILHFQLMLNSAFRSRSVVGRVIRSIADDARVRICADVLVEGAPIR